MMVPPRKRKEAQTLATTTFSIGNCTVQLPCNVEQERSTEKVCLKVLEPASICISVDKWNGRISDWRIPCNPGQVLPVGLSYQLLSPKSLDDAGKQLLERAECLYHQELPATSFAANPSKSTNSLMNCTTNGKYCTLLMKKPGATPTDDQVVVGAITYQILPPDTQYAEIALTAVDQSCQRKGLGSFLFRELARRLSDVGVLTLFCWGNEESEVFWSKQGFLKIAGVDSCGKPNKLPLKAEISMAMSLSESAALMVCNMSSSLLQVKSSLSSMNTVDDRHDLSMKTTVRTSVGEGEVRAPSDSTHVDALSSPRAGSVTSDTYSPTITPYRTLCSEPSPDQATIAQSSRFTVNTAMEPSTTASGSSSKYSAVITTSIPGSKPSAAKSYRTLSFAGVDEPLTTEPEPEPESVKKNSAAPGTITPKRNGLPSASGMGLKLASPGPVVITPGVIDSRPTLAVTPTTEMPCEQKTSTHLAVVDTCVASRLPFKDVKNTFGHAIVAPVKKRPWKRTQCDGPNLAAITPALPQAIDVDTRPEKEKINPAFKEIMEAEQDDIGITMRSGQKRSREKSLPAKVVGKRSIRRRRGDNTLTNRFFLTESEVLVSDATTASRPVLAPHSSKAVSVNHNIEIVDCKLSMADESFSRLEGSPYDEGDEQINSRMKKLENDPAIRKRSATRLVHVPEVAKATAQPPAGKNEVHPKAFNHVIFLMNMSNDSRKAALAQMVEKLGGRVTGDGGQCTHVVTGEVRRTLNFCTALCNGAWIVTSDWLKASSRHKGFVDEMPYLLRDRQFEAKYKVALGSVIQKARQKPCSVFAGFYVYPTPRVQPPLNTVIKLTQAAGGKIVSSLDEALRQDDPSHTIVLSCEEDMEEGIVAAKAGLQTFDGEWFMQCIVKQTLDLKAKLSDEF